MCSISILLAFGCVVRALSDRVCSMHTRKNWCIKDAFAYSKINLASAADCCAECQQDTRCMSWVFGQIGSGDSGGKCRLKNGTAPGEAEPSRNNRCAMAGSKLPWPSLRPNIILVLTDDMDITLGGIGAVPQVCGRARGKEKVLR